MKAYPPVIKWFGSKRPVATTLASYMPITYNRYYEPFLGGGAMMPFSAPHSGVANDIIAELIELWRNIKDNPNLVAEEYKKRWIRLQEEGADVFYEVRDNFNATKNCFDFLFLTRTCVNGMIRYNSKGEFNNAFHLSRPGINPETLASHIQKWSATIQRINFLNVDYKECLENVKENDFVFLDPPYGGTKDRYTKVVLNLEEFYSELERLNRIGAKWMLTFDGTSGDRRYNFAPPTDIYKEKFSIQTGLSAFRKVIDRQNEQINESVYLNYKPQKILGGLFDQIDEN